MWPQRKTNGKEEKGFLARRVASAVAQMWEGVWIASTEWRAQWRAHRGERKGVVRGQMVLNTRLRCQACPVGSECLQTCLQLIVESFFFFFFPKSAKVSFRSETMAVVYKK